MSSQAIVLAVVAMVSWGAWTVLANEATRTIHPEVAMILSYTAGVAIAVGYVAVRHESIALERTGVSLALAAGVFAGIAAVAFYSALSYGRVGVVATISALYFVVAAVFGVVFLGESVATREVLGIGFAALAVILLAGG